jgi:beta-carotene 3-hydroxylase
MNFGDILLNMGIVAVFAVAMEGVAWFTHKYIMHGFMWVWHEDHHRPRSLGFQKNDLFAVFFSLIAIAFFLAGDLLRFFPLTSAGIGITLYGIGYVLFHDIMFHKRLKRIRIPTRTPYLKGIVHAHVIHHQGSGRTGCTSFGFLYAPPRFRAEVSQGS